MSGRLAAWNKNGSHDAVLARLNAKVTPMCTSAAADLARSHRLRIRCSTRANACDQNYADAIALRCRAEEREFVPFMHELIAIAFARFARCF